LWAEAAHLSRGTDKSGVTQGSEGIGHFKIAVVFFGGRWLDDFVGATR